MALRQRQKRWILLLVFTAGLLYWFMREKAQLSTDREVSMASQIGFLKKKLAQLQNHQDQGLGVAPGGHFLAVKSGKVVLDDPSLPLIYIVTPTYARPAQKAELTRLCQTFLLVSNVHWIVVEDAQTTTRLVTNHLRRCGVPYTQLNVETPPEWKRQRGEAHWRKPR
jgi:hypothetical protein